MSFLGGVADLGSGHTSPEAIMMWEQFGRVGNTSTGQAFNRTREVDETVLVDVDGTNIYIGYAVPGTDLSASTWKIKRVNTANPISIYWADSSTLYNKVWNNRSTYTYA